MEGKYFFRYRKKMTMTSFTLFPHPSPPLLAYAFHTWAVRS